VFVGVLIGALLMYMLFTVKVVDPEEYNRTMKMRLEQNNAACQPATVECVCNCESPAMIMPWFELNYTNFTWIEFNETWDLPIIHENRTPWIYVEYDDLQFCSEEG